MSGVLLLGAAGIGAYYLYSQQQKEQNQRQKMNISEQPTVSDLGAEYTEGLLSGGVGNPEETFMTAVDEPACPDGYMLSADKTSCESVTMPNEPSCPDGYMLSDDKTECVSTAPVEQPPPDLNINTGSDVGNTAALIGIGLGAEVAYSGVASAAKAGVQQVSAAASAKKAADAAAKAAQVKKAKDAMVAAKAAKTASVAAKAGKASGILTKLKGTPWQLIIMAIAQVLIAVLDLNAESCNACVAGDFDLSTLPDWAKALISALPIVGDLFDLFSPVLCFRGGCAPLA